MRKISSTDVLWEIHFHPKEASEAKKAELILHPLNFEKQQKAFQPSKTASLELDFLEQLNHYFQDTTMRYLDKIEKTPENEKKIAEIQKKFENLSAWIAKIKKMFEQ